MNGKIIKGIAGFYYVYAEENETVYECKAKGIFRNKKIKPLVGDNVIISVLDKRTHEGNIDEILPRSNELIRPAVANVDQAVIVFAIKHPNPNLNLLDRFLIMLRLLDVPVIICFNKLDLISEEDTLFYRDIYERAGYKLLFISARDEKNVNQLKKVLDKKTTTLAGPSGVGKSTITNLVFPDACMQTSGISERIERGKHTTRHTEIFCIARDTYILDTPGFSSIYTPDIQADELKDCFPEFEQYEKDCKFNGCVHIGEKICGIKDAVLRGDISQSRYDNYKMIYQELKEKRRY